ncbi:hypothetical protein G3A43_06440 [Paraburkholderia aspalathi]|nr:ATP-binding protein [Paraburkholderia aspalathi]MBK3779887.1 hypothetical protein [Paraburkholderia aspalathi]
MEMLATTYSFMLMAAIREAIQNGCDAARRAGLSFAEGVQVFLPTIENPVITIVDQGWGMTKQFMEAKDGYLSFGTSTKRGDNGAAGGLGVGRWAAYGYIRECYITTTHESDMVERTYFQYQNADGSPSVRLASEVPGRTVGTRVFFPVKESDRHEAYRAVAWLKAVMQLTMKDSFSVDQPILLPNIMAGTADVPLNLGEVDPGLKGVVVHAMEGPLLKYNRQGLQAGSLVVLTNHEAGVGGLPFHVQTPGDKYSVFLQGMVVEIPMSFRVGFMPSREEIKYTDDVNLLLNRIDAAAAKAVVAKAGELYAEPSLSSKAALTRLLGSNQNHNSFALAARDAQSPIHKELTDATGRRPWQGSLTIAAPADVRAAVRDEGLRVKYMDSRVGVLREVRAGSTLLVAAASGKDWVEITFNPTEPLYLVVNDVAKYAQKRFRMWAERQGVGRFIFLNGKTPADSIAAAKSLNAAFGGALPLVHISTLPDVERRIAGGAVVRTAARGNITYYCTTARKQETKSMSLTERDGKEPKRFWLEKDGGKLTGFREGLTVNSMVNHYSGGLADVLKAVKVERLYLLTPKQVVELRTAQAEMEELDLEELKEAADDGDAEARTSLEMAKTLALWTPFEAALMGLMAAPEVKGVLEGTAFTKLTSDTFLTMLCGSLAKRPRMELTGTRFDRALSPYVDILSCVSHVRQKLETPHEKLHQGLSTIGACLEVRDDDTDERKAMVAAFRGFMERGHINYSAAASRLKEEFPLLKSVYNLDSRDERIVDDFCRAVGVLYR